MESGGVKASHKHSRAKSSVSSFKIIQKSASESKSADFHRQLFSGCLSEQARHPLSGNVCPNLENHGVDKCQGNPDSGETYSRESYCSSRFPVKERLGDSDRMGVESSSVQSDLPLLASANGRFVCNKVESQASNVYVSCPRQSGLEIDALNIFWEGLDACVLSSGSHSSGDSKGDHLQLQNHHNCTRVARMSWFWDLVDLSTKLPLRLPLWVNLLTQSFSNRLHNNLTYLNLHAWHLESVMNIQEDSQRWW